MRTAAVSRGRGTLSDVGRRTRCGFNFRVYSAPMPTFYDRFVDCSERWPKNIAVEVQRPDRVESHSYAELRRMAESFAVWLVTNGMPPGERIAILADNHPR